MNERYVPPPKQVDGRTEATGNNNDDDDDDDDEMRRHMSEKQKTAQAGAKKRSFAQIRQREAELRQERDRKIARGTANLRVMFVDNNRMTDRIDDFGKRSLKARHDEIPQIGDATTAADTPPADDDDGWRVVIGCCNSPHCRRDALGHAHAGDDWTAFGRLIGRARQPVQLPCVPDPYKLFPGASASVKIHERHPRDDVPLILSTMSREVGSLYVQIARTYHAQILNLTQTRDELFARPCVQLSSCVNYLEYEERALAEQIERRRVELALPMARRRLEFVTRDALHDMIDFCRLPPVPGQPRTALVERLLHTLALYRRDCDEAALAEYVHAVFLGRSAQQLDAIAARVGGIQLEPCLTEQASIDAVGNASAMEEDTANREGRDGGGGDDGEDTDNKTAARPAYGLHFPCGSQWSIGGEKPACAAIAVEACRVFLDKSLASATTDNNNNHRRHWLLRANWQAVVKAGLLVYDKWRHSAASDERRSDEKYMLVNEAIGVDAATKARFERYYRHEELAGNLFVPLDRDEQMNTARNFAEHVAELERSEPARANQPLADAFSSGHYTLALSRQADGSWWLFDSHGKDRDNRSTLAWFPSADGLVDYIDAFFGVGRAVDLRNERRDVKETALATMVSFSSYLMWNK